MLVRLFTLSTSYSEGLVWLFTYWLWEYLENQVTPFFLDTPDGEKIFAWHVLPLGLYKAHRDDLVKQPDGIPENVLQSEGIKLLMSDPEARLIIHCMCLFFAWFVCVGFC